MTRRHFEYMAEHIGKEYDTQVEVTAAQDLAIATGRAFNPSFDANKFRNRVIQYQQARKVVLS